MTTETPSDKVLEPQKWRLALHPLWPVTTSRATCEGLPSLPYTSLPQMICRCACGHLFLCRGTLWEGSQGWGGEVGIHSGQALPGESQQGAEKEHRSTGAFAKRGACPQQTSAHVWDIIAGTGLGHRLPHSRFSSCSPSATSALLHGRAGEGFQG